ncbi:MAG: serine hydrolase [Alphaproteobacteria bacterium]|nr:serine hydrolase [Alphaproteobacteria bacterium]
MSRRSMVSGLGATLLVGPASARIRKVAGSYGDAADYSAARRGVSLLVMQDGKMLFEDYPRPGGSAEAWELASGTKSFTGVMAAAAQADGLLDIEEPASKTLLEWRGDPRKSRITIRNLLSLNAGLEGKRAIGRPPDYLEAIEAPAIHDPGAVFEYTPTNFQIFGEIMRRKLRAAGRPDDPVVYLRARVLDRIQAPPSDWKRGRDGNPFMPQGAQYTARNWARFGQWVMDGGQGVDQRTFHAMFESSSANPGYGMSWWLLRPGLIGPDPRAGIDGAAIGEAAQKEDIVMAAGAGDQRLYLFRRRRLVVVRQANHIIRSFGPLAKKWRDEDFLRLMLT